MQKEKKNQKSNSGKFPRTSGFKLLESKNPIQWMKTKPNHGIFHDIFEMI